MLFLLLSSLSYNPMNISLPVADSFKIHSRFILVCELKLTLQCLIPYETLLKNQFTIHLHILLRKETFVGVYANLYGTRSYPNGRMVIDF
jgi:hypothetical protein